jgi:hypothetical protein
MTILKWLAFPFVFLAHKLWGVSVVLVGVIVFLSLVTVVVALCEIAFVNLAPDSIYILWIGTSRFFPFLDITDMVVTGSFGLMCLLFIAFVFIILRAFFSWICNNIRKTKETLGL